jgi:hypothetical protein
MKDQYKKWPLCRWELIGKPEIKEHSDVKAYEVTFRAAYQIENPSKSVWSKGKVLSKIMIAEGENGVPQIFIIKNKTYDIPDLKNENNTADQNRQSSKKLASKPSNFYEEIDRINSIPNQRDRADSGIELIKSMTRNIDNFNKQAVESNPNLFGGKSHEEFTYDSFYQQARDSGLPPSEAKIEATRNYNNYRRFIDQ